MKRQNNLNVAKHELVHICEWIESVVGLKFNADRQSLIEDACRTLMAEDKLREINDFKVRLKEDKLLLDRLLNLVTIPESYFFREPLHFDLLATRLISALPKYVEEGSQFKIWSAGCAGGEEIYSVALLIEELKLPQDQVLLLASDISRRALSRARKGVYSSWSLRGERAQKKALPSMQISGRSFLLPDKYRDSVRFFYLNLAANDYLEQQPLLNQIDVIFCRNVLIYFDTTTIAAVAERLFNTLACGGILITGPSDPVLSGYAPFSVQMTSAGLVYRKIPVSNLTVVDQGIATKITTFSKEIRLSEVNSRALSLEREKNTKLLIKSKLNSEDIIHTPPSGTKSQSSVINDLYMQAIELINLGKDELAIRQLRQMLYLEPDLLIAHFTSALLYIRREEFMYAEQALQNSLKLISIENSNDIVPLGSGETYAQCKRVIELYLQQCQHKGGRL